MKRLAPLLLLALPVIARAEEIEAHGEGVEGIPWAKIALHALNLVVLFGIIGWFARKPLKDAIASRATNVKKDMDDINALRKQAQDRYAEVETRLQAYDKKLAEMKGQAEQEAAAEAREIAARAERDAQQIQAAAQRTIRDETLRARQALRADAVELAVKIAEEQLKRTITEEDQRRLASEFLHTVESNRNG
jgi:F-type H+-transporting ATPase subunit b